ncbi:MAG: imidazole glycerol phosphate synthase subunit HisH [Nanoarchaeota archaeon]
MIAIIDYGLGNLRSISNALTSLNIAHEITNNPSKIEKADKLILPGVGAFKTGMKNLRDLGVIDILNKEVLTKKKPVLGICLGMQLMCQKSYEGGVCDGLGWIDAEVVKFNFPGNNLRIPHVGWNDTKCDSSCPILSSAGEKQTFYFVHSYYPNISDPSIIKGVCNYGHDFCAILQKDNIFATQFHPEKSQYEGLEILRKFNEV